MRCINCYFWKDGFGEDMCADCVASKWKPKVEEKDCDNCKYEEKDGGLNPCKNCSVPNNGTLVLLEPKEAQDNVNHPAHYKAFPVEVIDIIRETLTTEQFIGYCLGNEIKYRLRAGIKDKEKIVEDISKAEKYREWRNKAMIEEL